jgi:PAS domain S-box-containing protein
LASGTKRKARFKDRGDATFLRNVKSVPVKPGLKEECEKTFDAIPDLIYIIDAQHTLLRVNQALADRLGLPPEDVVGRKCFEVFHGTDRPPGYCIHARSIAEGKHYTAEIFKKRLKGHYQVSISPFCFEGLGMEGSIHVAREITGRKRAEERMKASLREKEILIREIYHRSKNNLTVISGLLNLQAQSMKDREAAGVFREANNRVRSMSMIHERLCRSAAAGSIDFPEYVRALADELFNSFGARRPKVVAKVDIPDIPLDINTIIPMGMLVNELVTNALKHAFPGNAKGEIRVSANMDEKAGYTLAVSDTGVGLPEGLDVRDTDTLGMQLITMLSKQLNGSIEVLRDKGTEFRISCKGIP